MPEASGAYWVAIDVAAVALGVSIKAAYRLAKDDKWRTSPGKQRDYLIDDIRATARRRREPKSTARPKLR